MKNFSKTIFEYRSYTPIPFLLVMLVFQKATTLSLIIGFLIVGAGELIRLWGVSYAGSETRTTGVPGGTFLIISGPFRYVKNPLYLGNILLYLGIGIMSMALFPYLQIAALFFFYFQYHAIISEEEKYLFNQFGDAYRDYYNKVPKLIPNFKTYKNDNIQQPSFSLQAGLKSERRTFQAITVVIILLVIVMIFEINKTLVG